MVSPSLSYEISWEKEPVGGAEQATWGQLCVRLGDDYLWGAKEGERVTAVRWTWVDLLEHLADVWPWLVWEEGWPAGPRVSDPRRFLADSQQWLGQLGAKEAAEQEDVLYEFRHRHDLALAIRGKILPPLWVVREGRNACVAGPHQSALIPHDHVLMCLTNLGEEIVTRLGGLTDDRSVHAIESWKQRLEIDRMLAASISIGVTIDELAALSDGDVAATFEIDPTGSAADFEPNELLAAARMAVPSTDSSVVRTIIAAMRSVELRETSELDRLAQSAAVYLSSEAADGQKPALLGHELARWFRSELGIAQDELLEPASLLTKWNVYLGELALDDEGIEAIACWGKAHGPAVLVNGCGRHSRDEGGRRATLAHEICHILVDRGAALPLAEVFGGHVFRAVEQRAGAFAAELLMPGNIAGSAFQSTTAPRDVLESLVTQYGASREIIAWQAYNGGLGMKWDTFAVLRSQVSHPERFLWKVASGHG